jgi:chloramphenicol-sensitive protein RarD
MSKGIWYAVGAYSLWGLMPVYWKSLDRVPALQMLNHRILWSFLMLFFFSVFLHRGKTSSSVALTRRVVGIYVMAAALISINWLTYMWAVNAGFIIETSLGYFISPLLSVLIGVLFFRERLRPWQWVAIGLASGGVLYLTFAYGSPPWIALTLAGTFAIYGIVKKTAPLGSFYGLTLETGILILPAIVYLLYSEVAGRGAFLHTGRSVDLLLIGTGAVTTVPLLMFASAARRIPLSLLGILQYIAPTLQFLLGLIFYREPFEHSQFVGYGIVWLALILFGLEQAIFRRIHSAAGAD